jgi:protein SCO1/2
MSERRLMLIAAALAAVLVGLVLWWQPAVPERPLPKVAQITGGDFTLQTVSGPVSLQDYRGKLVLLYFGYTFCPDICPTSLAATSAGLKLLTPEEAAKVAMLFVSVDPARDTPARLKEYVEFFHPAMVGATGSPEVLAEIARRYGVFYARQKTTGDDVHYAVDHTSETYLIGPQGDLLSRIPHATPADQVALILRKYLP